MKALKYNIILSALAAATTVLLSCSGYYVATGPPLPPDEVIWIAPSPQYVWVPGYYAYSGGTYIWIQGSYQIPPPGKTRYVHGDWVKTPRGYKKGRGHWR